MSDADQPRHELARLLEQLAEESLSPADGDRLASLLGEDPQAEAMYHGFMEIHALLLCRFGRQDVSQFSGFAPVDASSPLAPPSGADSPPPLADFNSPANSVWGVFFKPGWSVAAASCVTALVAVFSLWGMLALGIIRGPGAVNELATIEAPEVLQDDSTVAVVSRLSFNADVFGPSNQVSQGYSLRPGKLIQLEHGLMQLDFAEGARVILEGPAEFLAMGPQEGFLQSGKLVVRGDAGFVVHSPVAAARGADAEFGVAMEPARVMEVLVYAGQVVIAAESPSLEPADGRRVLTEKESLRIERPANGEGPWTTISPTRPPEFARRWSAQQRELSAYAQAVLAERPLGYWRLDEVIGRRHVKDVARHRYAGYPFGDWPEAVAANDADAGARFDGQRFIEVDSVWESDFRSGLTVEAWARVMDGAGRYRCVLASRYSQERLTAYEQCFGFVLYAGDQDRWQFWTGGGKMGELWHRVHGPPVVPRRWQHVVATFTPDAGSEALSEGPMLGVGRLYVDGLEAATGQQRFSPNYEWPTRIGASEDIPRHSVAFSFDGFLRDIAVYDRPLSADRIAAHYRLGEATTQ